jgi:hypothetical protein
MKTGNQEIDKAFGEFLFFAVMQINSLDDDSLAFRLALHVVDLAGVSREVVASKCKSDRSTVGRWAKGHSAPAHAHLVTALLVSMICERARELT